MIEYIQGDIFASPAQVIVNTVNTVGVMGKGLALSFKNRYPDMFAAYRTACEKRQLMIGKLMLYYAPDHWILLFPTKEHWRYPSKLEYIEKGLSKFADRYANNNITSVAFPRLGCGNGELSWDDVRPLMERYLKPLPIDVYIYLSTLNDPSPEHKNQKETLDWLKGYAKDMSFNGIKDDILHSSSIMPITFLFDNVQWAAKWENGLIFQDQNQMEPIKIPEDELFAAWDDIRNKSLFPITQASKELNLIYALLKHLGYLNPIQIKDSKTGRMMDGYQLNEGSRRVFALEGVIK